VLGYSDRAAAGDTIIDMSSVQGAVGDEVASESRPASAATEIVGVVVRPRVMHLDDRGSVCELFRVDEDNGFEPRQWHALTSRAGTLRGMHLHLRHWDYKLVVAGREALVLKDLRRGSHSEGHSVRLEPAAAELTAITIPPGVAHGLYSYTDSVTLVASSALYDPSDEFQFHWDDSELGVPWPVAPAHLSQRDREAQPLRSLIRQIEGLQTPAEAL
jgi:dTDP-4-dehydrorhamnose 3,5-epimerase